jgi:hypothetical protein
VPGRFGRIDAVVRRNRADWPVVLAAALLLLCATTLVTAAAVYGDSVALGSLRRTLAQAPTADRSVVVGTSAKSADVGALDEVVFGELAATLGPSGGEVALVTRSGAFERAGTGVTGAGTGTPGATAAPAPADTGGPAPADPAATADITVLASYPGIDAHATLVDGRWAEPGATPMEATLSEGAAAALRVSVGDTVPLVSRTAPSLAPEVLVTGIWRPDRADPFWLADPLELDGIERTGGFTTRGPFVVARSDLADRATARAVELQWRALPAFEALRPDDVEPLRQDVASLRERLAALVSPRTAPTVVTDLPAILADVGRSIVVSRSGVLLLTVQFAVLALYAILLVAGMLVDRRRLDTALLRSRGASDGDLTGMAVTEALLLAAPAAILAPILAVGIVRALGAVGPLAAAGVVTDVGIGGTAILVSVLSALVCVVAFTVPAVLSATSPAVVRAFRGRQLARTLPQRLGLDVVLLVLAAIGVWQLRLYGSPLTEDARGVLGLDPLLVIAPAIGLVAGAVLAVRLLPRLAEIAERGMGRTRGSVAPLVARQLARRPLRYTRSSLLLMLAAALFTFAAAYAATWTRSQADQAAYASAADLRAIQPDVPVLPAWSAGAAYRSMPGVETAMPVDRQALDVGKAIRGGVVLGLDPTAAATIVTMPPDADGAAIPGLLPRLAAGRPGRPSVALPGTPARLAVTVDAALAAEQTTPLEPTYPSVAGAVTIAAVLEDADGSLFRIEGGPVEPSGGRQRVVIPLGGSVAGVDVAPAYPLHLESIELAISSATGQTTTGTLDVTGVEVSDDAAGDAWTAVPFDAGAVGWRWTRIDGSTPSAYVPPGGMPGRIAVGTAPGMSEPIERFAFDSDAGPVFRLWATGPDVEVPAIAAGSFLAASGARVGDAIAATSSGLPVTLRIVGEVGTFPPLDPATPSVVVDGATLEWLRFATSGQVATPDEWWLSVADADSATVAAALEAPPFTAEVVARTVLAASLSGDPIPLGVIGALGLGALAALVIAAIGFVVSASISTSERIAEFALLRAIGLSPRQLAAWLAVEHAFLLAFGIVAGVGLGLLLAWLVLPFSTLTASGAAAVPAPAVVVPWEAVLPLGVAGLVLYLITVAIVARQATTISVAGILRSREA